MTSTTQTWGLIGGRNMTSTAQTWGLICRDKMSSHVARKLAPWPRKFQGSKILHKFRRIFVVTLRQEGFGSWDHAQSIGLQKLPHFDLLNFQIRPTVQKLAPGHGQGSAARDMRRQLARDKQCRLAWDKRRRLRP